MFSAWQRLVDSDLKAITSTVRYRLLVLMLLPVLATLAAMVFISIYWNVTYTGEQLMMKVRGDLEVANGWLDRQHREQERALALVQENARVRLALAQRPSGGNQLEQALEPLRRQLKLDFLRFVSLEESLLDAQLRQLVPYGQARGRSGFQLMAPAALASLREDLPPRARVILRPTTMASMPSAAVEDRGLVSRSLVVVKDLLGQRIGFLDGGVLLNRNQRVVDTIRDLTYGEGSLPARAQPAVTLFLDNVRVATNVPDASEGLALGSLVSDQVRYKVMQQGETWIDRAFVLNEWYVSAYHPIQDTRGRRIGMLYTGFTEASYIHNYLVNIIELGAILVLVIFGSGLAVYRGAIGLLKPLERINTVVREVQQGHSPRIGALGLAPSNELAQLAQQFDSMLDQLEERNQLIRAAANELEQKVAERTLSLQQRTQELKDNIDLLETTRQQMVTNEKLAALGELTAGIAHEINNPTAVILGNIELIKLELGDTDHEVEEEVETIVQQVYRIKAIIQSLLQYARPGEMDMPLERQPVNPIIEEMLVLVRHSLRKQSVEVELALDAMAPVHVNRQQLMQVLINLVVNAAHAVEKRGLIQVGSGDWIEDGVVKGAWIRVEDNGCGMPAELLTKIFDPFFTTRKQGTGLGLALSYGIIRRFGGEMNVESEPGEGTVFTVRLPSEAGTGSEQGPITLR